MTWLLIAHIVTAEEQQRLFKEDLAACRRHMTDMNEGRCRSMGETSIRYC